jgi:DNA-directed RNA polymerase sigma subunit (sigma70/sigma32)
MVPARTRRSDALKDYLSVVAALPRRGPAQREALAARLAGGDASAAVGLVECFLPLVVAEAALHRGLGLRFEALLAVGNRALAACLRRTGVPHELSVRRAVRRALRASLAQAAVRRSA